MSTFSSSPQHLPINASLLDEAVHSTARTYVDRFGRTRTTLKAVEESVPAAISARDRAETARDIAVAAAGPFYDTEAEGRAAVADGETFKVVGSGDVAARLYRRINADASDILAELPSKQAVDAASEQQAYWDRVHVTERNGDPLIALADVDGDVVLQVAEDGGLYIPGLDSSVQGAFEDVERKINTNGDIEESIHSFCDADGDEVIRITKDGDLVSPKFGRLSDALKVSEAPPALNVSRSAGDLFTREVLDAVACSGGGVPMPFSICPTRRNFGEAWLGNVTVSENEEINLITPYDPRNRVVHPYLMEFFNGWNGWRYILGLTGYTYTNENEENPFIMGSNNLRDWTLITDGVLAEDPPVPSGHNSDIALAHDPRTGELICFWRQTLRFETGTEDSLWLRKTRDGKNWTDAELMFGPNLRADEIALSPTVVFDPVEFKWHLYMGSSIGSLYALRHFKGDSITGPWLHINDVTVPTAFKLWHCEVKWVGNRLVVLVQDNTTGSKNLYFGISDVGSFSNFTFNSTPVVAPFTWGMYKASFLPVHDDKNGLVAFDIAWTGDNTPSNQDDRWKLFINRTNFSLEVE